MAGQIQWRGPNIITDGLVFYMNANSPSCYNSSSYFNPIPSNALRNLSGFTTYSGSVNSSSFAYNPPSSSFSFPNSSSGTGSSWIGIADNPAIQFGAGSFTFILWTKPNNTNDRCALISKRSGASPFPQLSCLQGTILSNIDTTPTKKISMLIRNGSTNNTNYAINTNNDIADGTWKHIVFTRNSSIPSVSIYVNNQLQPVTIVNSNATNILGNVSIPGWNINIGNNNGNGTNPASASAQTPTSDHNTPYPISSVQIYNRALSETEIAYNYNNSKALYGL